MFCHEYVPAGFGYGTVIPLIKDKMGNLNDEINYRPITLIPVVSKKFLDAYYWRYIKTD